MGGTRTAEEAVMRSQNLLGEAEEAVFSKEAKEFFEKKLEQQKHYSLTLDSQRNQNHQQEEEEEEEEEHHQYTRHVEGEGGGEAEQNYNNVQQDQHLSSILGLDTQLLHLHQQQPLKKRSYFPSTTSIQYARKMGESHNQATTSSRLGIRNSGGEIVEVQGGHIVRSTGRKDRHSKVCTAKGPRDRRVRLSAHTAIQFYDVQDRLGYDRPSKAVDWLINKAKAAIDELAELPPWNPETVVTNTTTTSRASTRTGNAQQQSDEGRNFHFSVGSSNDVQIVETQNQNSSFLPPALDSDSIADTIKSFFPTGASSNDTATFQNYPPGLLSRTTSHSQDLRLSLQSFQEPNSILLQQQQQQQHQPHPHHHAHSHSHSHSHHHHQQQQQQNEQVQVLFSGTTPLGYDTASAASAWSESAEMSRFQRMMAWNSGGAADTAGNASVGAAGGFLFNSQPPPPPLQPLFGQNQLFHSQRGPLQSSNTPSVRAWIDQPIGLTNDHQHHHHHHHHQILQPPIHQSVISGIGFASPVGEFSGFRIPARIQGEDEEHDGIHNRPSSASSDSHH